jgi:hypothetical protein
MEEHSACRDGTDTPGWFHRVWFAVMLATLSMSLPEVLTMNDPIPWTNPGGWILGYPVYGLHVLVLGAVLYRFCRVNLVTLLAFGGMFGLYEGYLIKQLWNPNWSVEMTLSVGGVRVLHTLFLVFFVHPLLAFIVPLAVCETFCTRPGPLRRAVPWLRGRKGTLATLFGFALWAGLMLGGNMAERGGRSAMAAPVTLVLVTGVLCGIWRFGLGGSRFEIADLFPKGWGLWILSGLLGVLYIAGTMLIRPEALPDGLLPHLTVWGIYAFFVTLILLYRCREPAAEGVAPPWVVPLWVAPAAVCVFFAVAFLQAPSRQPGMTVTVLSFVGGGIVNIVFLAVCLARAVVRSSAPADGTGQAP